MDCKGICNADCCKFMLLSLNNKDHALWAKHHGFKTFKTEDDRYVMRIEKECDQLENNLCKVMYTEQRPKMCGMFWCKNTPNLEEI